MTGSYVLTGMLMLMVIIYAVKTRSLGRAVRRVAIKAAFSGVLLFIANMLGNHYGIHLGVNGYTVAAVSLLGVPGIGAITIIQNFII